MRYAGACALCLIIGYLFGCILHAELVARRTLGKSAFEIGSGNPGVANITREAGKKAGVFVLLGDVLKTAFAVAASWLIFGGTLDRESFLWAGFGAVLGHNFPFWHKFRGGKGVTVTCTWLILYAPLWGILCCALGGFLTLLTGYLPLGAVLIPLFAIPFAFYFEGTTAGVFMLLALILMFSRHYRGLVRIAKGEEKRKFRKG